MAAFFVAAADDDEVKKFFEIMGINVLGYGESFGPLFKVLSLI